MIHPDDIDKKLDFSDFMLNIYHKQASDSSGTLVFLHDSLGCNALWRSFPEKLGRLSGKNVFAYDRRGYGLSSPFADTVRGKNYLDQEADLLLQILHRLNIDQPILFGHSDGGSIALLAAAKSPELIKAVITEGAHVFVEDITLEGIETVKEQYQHTDLKKRLEQYHGDKTQALFEAWTQTWLSPDFRDWNMEATLPMIVCPVLVIQGVEDEFGSKEQVQSIAENVSGPSEIFMVTNARHTPHRQCEDWLIEKCCVFLDRHHLL